MDSTVVPVVDTATSLDNGTTTPDTTSPPSSGGGGGGGGGGLQPTWLVIVIPIVVVIGVSLIGLAVFLWLRQRRKATRRGSRHSHERGQGRTGSTVDLPTSAAPMGEGLNELGEAPPPYPPPPHDGPKDHVMETVIERQEGAAGESSASSSSTAPSDGAPGPSTAAPEMTQTRNSDPPAYDAVMSRRVVSLTVPPTAVAGVTIAAPHA